MLVHLDDEFLHVHGRRIRWFLVVGHVWVAEHKGVDPAEGQGPTLVGRVSGSGPAGQLRSADGQEAPGSRIPKLCEGFHPGLFETEFDVAQVRIGYTGVGLNLPQGLGAAEISEELPDGWAPAGLVVLFFILVISVGLDALQLMALVRLLCNNHC